MQARRKIAVAGTTGKVGRHVVRARGRRTHAWESRFSAWTWSASDDPNGGTTMLKKWCTWRCW